MSQTKFDSKVISMRCLVARPGDNFEWHSHPFEEFTLVTDDQAVIGRSGKQQTLSPNTLCFYPRGQKHGGWCMRRQRPKFWVVHFGANEGLQLPLYTPDPAKDQVHIWRLSVEQAEMFKWLFLHLLHEGLHARNYRDPAESCWLHLLLISVQRWAEGEHAAARTFAGVKPEVMELWHLVNSSVAKPDEFAQGIHKLPNYDSARHGFSKIFGASPRELLGRMRMQQAKNLLLETTMSVKEIAGLTGYGRQHEFARAFRQRFGITPSEWRTDPFQTSFTTPPKEDADSKFHRVPA